MRTLRLIPRPLATASLIAAAGLLAGCTSPGQRTGSSAAPQQQPTAGLTGIHKIRHVIIIMQENRSFDTYFGTYPGADGIPMRGGVATVCAPNPAGGCTRPYHDTADVNGGGPHGENNAAADVDGGRMDGFIRQQHRSLHACRNVNDPACSHRARAGVMGYHTAAELPSYWAYARNYVLTDHMFEPVKSWSLPDHLYLVSAWSASCATPAPMSCVTDIAGPYQGRQFDRAVDQEVSTGTTSIDLAWTDITWLLHAEHVSWAYYVQKGTQPDCADDSAQTCAPVKQNAATPGIWNPLPLFGDVR